MNYKLYKSLVRDSKQRNVSYGELVALEEEFDKQVAEQKLNLDEEERDILLSDFVQKYIDGDDDPKIGDSKRIKDSKSQRDEFDEVVTKIAEDNDYSVHIGRTDFEFGKYTSFGQDFSAIATVDDSDSFEDLRLSLDDSLSNYIEWFDPEEQADLWSEVVDYDEYGREIREGKNGAPTNYEDIVADMEEAIHDLEDFRIVLKRELEDYSDSHGYME